MYPLWKKSPEKTIVEIPRKIKKQLYLPKYLPIGILQDLCSDLAVTNKTTKFDESVSWFCVYRTISSGE